MKKNRKTMRLVALLLLFLGTCCVVSQAETVSPEESLESELGRILHDTQLSTPDKVQMLRQRGEPACLFLENTLKQGGTIPENFPELYLEVCGEDAKKAILEQLPVFSIRSERAYLAQDLLRALASCVDAEVERVLSHIVGGSGPADMHCIETRIVAAGILAGSDSPEMSRLGADYVLLCYHWFCAHNYGYEDFTAIFSFEEAAARGFQDERLLDLLSRCMHLSVSESAQFTLETLEQTIRHGGLTRETYEKVFTIVVTAAEEYYADDPYNGMQYCMEVATFLLGQTPPPAADCLKRMEVVLKGLEQALIEVREHYKERYKDSPDLVRIEGNLDKVRALIEKLHRVLP